MVFKPYLHCHNQHSGNSYYRDPAFARNIGAPHNQREVAEVATRDAVWPAFDCPRMHSPCRPGEHRYMARNKLGSGEASAFVRIGHVKEPLDICLTVQAWCLSDVAWDMAWDMMDVWTIAHQYAKLCISSSVPSIH